MKKYLSIAIFILTGQFTYSQSKEICITLDDLPVVSYDFKDIEFQQSLVNNLIQTFDMYQIPAIRFAKKAPKDGAYSNEISTYNNWGISWIDRWALSAGKKVIFSKGIRKLRIMWKRF